jgi:hypothetical protein
MALRGPRLRLDGCPRSRRPAEPSEPPSRLLFQELPEPEVAQVKVSQLEAVPTVGSGSDRPLKVSLLPSQLSTLLGPEA